MSVATIREVPALAVKRTAKGARIYSAKGYRDYGYINATRTGLAALLHCDDGEVLVFGAEALLDELLGPYRTEGRRMPDKGVRGIWAQARGARPLDMDAAPESARQVAKAIDLWAEGRLSIAKAVEAAGVTFSEWSNWTSPGRALHGARERARLARKLKAEAA